MHAAVPITYLLPNKHVWKMNKIRHDTTSYTPHHVQECGLLQKSKEIPTPWHIYVEFIFLPEKCKQGKGSYTIYKKSR